jgi:two-component system, NarL family, nitrate/nitrite response regulator NarL
VSSTKKAKILLADDNAAVLEQVCQLLRRDNQYDVISTVSDGSAVLHECLIHNPDVIVLDISMGELSGLEVANQLRGSECLAKIVFLTLHQDPDFVHAAMDAGGGGICHKIPFGHGPDFCNSRSAFGKRFRVN